MSESGKRVEAFVERDAVYSIYLSFVLFGLLVFVEVLIAVALEAEIIFAQVCRLEVEVLDAATTFNRGNREPFAITEA